MNRNLLVKMLPCLCCEQEGVDQPNPTESHHQNFDGKAGKKRLGDEYTVPLCGWHHRSVCLPGITADRMTFEYGPSLNLLSRRFRECYGTDDQLLELTNLKLRNVA